MLELLRGITHALRELILFIGVYIKREKKYSLLMMSLAMLMLTGSAVADSYLGFGLDTSRVIVMADARGGTLVTALNNSDNVYLVQSRVEPADGVTGYPLRQANKGDSNTQDVPFLVTPPLKKMMAQSRLPLRILVTPDNHLPQDRESLFFLSAKAIPSIQPRLKTADTDSQGPRIVLALQQYVKLFWRPASLKSYAIFDGDVAGKLTFSRSGQSLLVNNPTPYYITFWLLKVDGKPVDPMSLRAMVPPKGNQRYPLPTGVRGARIEWQIIDEFGLVTAPQNHHLS